MFAVAHELSMLPERVVALLADASPFADWTVAGGFDDDSLSDGDTVQVWTLET